MAGVLQVYKEVEVINRGLVKGTLREPGTVTVSYDEKPGIQALSVTTPDRPPSPGLHPSHIRDYEYKRLGTVSLLAGPDPHPGKATDHMKQPQQTPHVHPFTQKTVHAQSSSHPHPLSLHHT